MTKKELLARLREELQGYSRDEVNKSIDFYSEMIDDRMEDGATEAEAVASLGSVEDIAKAIECELPLKSLIRHSVQEKTAARGENWAPNIALIILLILGAPLWLPFAITFIILAFVGYFLLWLGDALLYIFSFVGAAAIIYGIGGFVHYMIIGQSATACASFGIAVGGSGMAILLFIAGWYFAKAIVLFGIGVIKGTKRKIVGMKKGE